MSDEMPHGNFFPFSQTKKSNCTTTKRIIFGYTFNPPIITPWNEY